MRPARIDGLIVDVDGTLLVHDRAVPGAAELLAGCARRGIPYRIVTNTTRRSRASTAAALRKAGLDVSDEVVLQPAVLARRLILDSGRLRTGLLVPEDVRADLAGVEEDSRSPDWVVVGDVGPRFGFDALNAGLPLAAGRGSSAGAPQEPLLAAERRGRTGCSTPGLSWPRSSTPRASTAEVVGKPSPAFFRLALRDMGLEAERVLVVGDDVENDARGGSAAGCRTALVKTGKFQGSPAELAGFEPDLVLDSVADLAL